MPQAIDHVVVAVHDLNQAIADYERLGFTVTIGGDHAHRGSHNALITFDDGSYIELIAFKHEPPVKDNTWWDVLQIGEGLVDFALVCGDLRAELEHLRTLEFEITGPMEGGRLRTDGVRIAWRVARLNTAGPERLPFLIDDITDHDLRVPRGADAVHANGVTGIAGVTVAVSAKANADPLYRSLLGGPDSTGASTRFHVGDQFVDLVDADSGAPEVDGFLSSRGSGPFEVTLRGPDPVPGFPANLTHSARFTVEHDASI
ncbi:MAG: VOC family protein [Chloroflexota bacterium]|nr:VOC family protein [Chloroflexota bacterium]